MSQEARRRLAERLKQAREYLGLSQEDVAVHLGLARPAISQIEHGNRRVDAIELGKLAQLYRRPVSHFTGQGPADELGDMEVLGRLKRATADLSDQDREEVLRFAEFLRSKSTSAEPK